MLKLYSALIIAFCNTAFVVCMQKEKKQDMTVVCNDPHARYVASTYSTDNQIIDSNDFELDIIKHKFQSISKKKPLVGNQLVYEPVVHPRTMTVPNGKKENPLDNAYDIVVQTKPCLTTIPLSQMINKTCDAVFFKRKHMRELYDKVGLLFNKPHSITIDNAIKLISLTKDTITACNEAKQYDINEDIMGKFAFSLPGQSIEDRCKVALFCGLLKTYNKSVLTEDGNVSTSLYYKVSPLARSFNLVTDIVQQQLTCSLAMKSLIHALSTIDGTIDSILEELNDFVSFLYSGKKLDQKENNFESIVVTQDWKRDALHKSFHFLGFYDERETDQLNDELLHIIGFIAKAKKNGLIVNEYDLGYYALEYKTTFQDSFSMTPIENCYDTEKEKISLFCLFIEHYLKTAKKTPSWQDCNYCDIANELSISFPDDFDSRLLDDNYVAFKEYEKLCQDIINLRQASCSVVHECVEKLYPVRNK